MLGNARFGEVVELFVDQVRGLVVGGVDVLLIETAQDILELKAAVHAILRVRAETGRAVPIQAQVTLDTSGRMLDAGAIGVRLIEGFQFEPEQTRAALVVAHPDARYFALARTGGADGEG